MRRGRNRRKERPDSLKLRLDLLDIVECVHFGVLSALGVFVSAAYVHVLPARTYGCIYMFLHLLDFVTVLYHVSMHRAKGGPSRVNTSGLIKKKIEGGVEGWFWICP